MLKRKRLGTQDFRIGWICAIQVEVDAARVVLDEEYEDIDEAAACILGRVSGHNVVIACPPAGEYGIGAAAVTAERLRALFPDIRYWLMVGVGGGVPSSTSDIRLGDVVVSQPQGEYGGVVHYDKGKMGRGGQRTPSGSLNRPPQELLTAVTKLRSNVNSGTSGIGSLLTSSASTNPVRFKRPVPSNDVLFESSYDHVPGHTCAACSSERIVPRPPRENSDIVLHYGLIASGDKVIKDGTTRDSLSKEYGNILCFETEAAGLMNNFPCLVIRGICDYADSHKNKDWQPFAAFAAAVCAKEVLKCVSSARRSSNPQSDSFGIRSPMLSRTSTFRETSDLTPVDSMSFGQISTQSDSQLVLAGSALSHEERRLLFESLRFEQLEFRHLSIKAAHKETCQWFLSRSEFVDWLDTQKMKGHQGFLWIKGKAATGKSTIMKLVFSHVRKARSADVIAAFFFNARGEAIEKTTVGMYRSLLYQVLMQCPDLLSIFDLHIVTYDASGNPIWTLNNLQTLLRFCVEKLGSRSVILMIDALDECDNKEVQEMVKFLEEVCNAALEASSQVRVLFSSRHYPEVTILASLSLTLEHQKEHDDDIAEYLRHELKAGKSQKVQQIQETIIEKASGIFLWVVLVVDILNEAYRRGKIHALERELKKVPSDIEALFHDILNRGGKCSDETCLCIQWVLYSKRPLKLEELYFAILSELDPESVKVWDDTEITKEDMVKFILDTSKGLLEQTRTKARTFQFIHESVREYFLHGKGLGEPPFAPPDTFPARSHERLKMGCWEYCQRSFVRSSSEDDKRKSSMANLEKGLDSHNYRAWLVASFPLLEYATRRVLTHSEAAAQLGLPQVPFLNERFKFEQWLYLYSLFEKNEKRLADYGNSALYAYADNDWLQAMRTALQRPHPLEGLESSHRWLVLAGLVAEDEENMNVAEKWIRNVKRIEQLPAEIRFSDKAVAQVMAFLRDGRRSITGKESEHPILWAARTGQRAVVRILLACGELNLSVSNYQGYDAAELALANGHTNVLHLLVGKENSRLDLRQKWIKWAVDKGNLSLLEHVLRESPEMSVEVLKEALCACRSQQKVMTWLLTRPSINTTLDTSYKHAMLIMAAKHGYADVVKLLLGHSDVDVNYKVDDNWTSLMLAAVAGHVEIIELLLERTDIRINKRNRSSDTALILAAKNNRLKIVKLLLAHEDTKVNRANDHKETALAIAVRKNRIGMVEALLQRKDIEVNPKNRKSRMHLMVALKESFSEVVKLLLKQDKLVVDFRDERGWTPLKLSLEQGRADALKLIMSHQNFDLKFYIDEKEDLLHLAIKMGMLSFIDFLAEHKDPILMRVDSSGTTPLKKAIKTKQVEIVRALLQYENESKGPSDIDAISQLQNSSKLMKDGSNASPTKSKHEASSSTMKPPNSIENSEAECTTSATSHKYRFEGIDKLHEHLFEAAKAGDVDMLKIILTQKGIEVNRRDRFGSTAYRIANVYKHEEAATLLESYGGRDIDIFDD